MPNSAANPDVAHASRRAVSPFVATCLASRPRDEIGDDEIG